jgi:hypothetical protein
MTYFDDIQMLKQVFLETARHANGLAIGLQNAAPPQDNPPPSVRYLTETTEQLQERLSKLNELIQELSSPK